MLNYIIDLKKFPVTAIAKETEKITPLPVTILLCGLYLETELQDKCVSDRSLHRTTTGIILEKSQISV